MNKSEIIIVKCSIGPYPRPMAEGMLDPMPEVKVQFNNGEDSLFMFAISDKINTISNTSEHAIYYRQIRPNSAMTSFKSEKYLFCNQFKLQMAYIKQWMKNPFKYNFLFFISRLVATELVYIRHLLGKSKNNAIQYTK